MVLKSMLVVAFACLCFTNGFAQARELAPSFSEIEIPSFILNQPLSPLRIEKAQVAKVGGKSSLFYVVRNVGKKPIKGYTIARWYSDNTGSVMTGAMPANHLLAPGEDITFGEAVIPAASPSSGVRFEVLALFMVVQVSFADGSSYSDGERMSALEDHLRLFEFAYDKRKLGKK